MCEENVFPKGGEGQGTIINVKRTIANDSSHYINQSKYFNSYY